MELINSALPDSYKDASVLLCEYGSVRCRVLGMAYVVGPGALKFHAGHMCVYTCIHTQRQYMSILGIYTYSMRA